jgi:transcriptional regulator with XRE-family HTH domain
MRSIAMTDGSTILPKDTLWQDYFANLKTALSSMRQIFKLRADKDGLTQDDIAESLDINKSLVSRRLNGEENFTLRTLSFMATAMHCRLHIRFRPYEELGYGNNYDIAHDEHGQLRGLPNNDARQNNDAPKGIE